MGVPLATEVAVTATLTGELIVLVLRRPPNKHWSSEKALMRASSRGPVSYME